MARNKISRIPDQPAKIAVFKGKGIRKTLHNNEWFFVVEDVVLALTDSADPKQYIKRMRERDNELRKGWVQIVPTLWVETSGGRQQMNCANTESVFRIIQSIPSPKAEPFKRQLARSGHEYLQELEDPELAMKRTSDLRDQSTDLDLRDCSQQGCGGNGAE